MNQIEIEILTANYWEHFRYAKELSFILPIEHPKRKSLDIEMNKMLEKINKYKIDHP